MNAPKRWKEPGSDASPALRSALSYAGKRAPDAGYAAALTDAVLGQVSAPDPALVASATFKASATAAGRKLLGLTLVAGLTGVGGIALYLAHESAAPGVQGAVVMPEPSRAAEGEAEPSPDAPALAPERPSPAAQAEPKSGERSARSRTPKRAQTEASVDELGLLQSARVARATSEAHALTLLRQHERSFPDSDLREERDALLIELLSRADPRAAAERAAAFLQRFPSSAYRERITKFGEAGR